jgi:precorrin-2 C(20)-methyltransferase
MSHFWAIGVGPGPQEQMTVRAVQLVSRADVIYHPGPGERAGRAWVIIRALVRPGQEVRRLLAEPMRAVSAAADWTGPYRRGVEAIAEDCRRGREVIFVTEGDPSLYSTAFPVCQLLAEVAPEIPITVVPGISSISAAAARARWPLARNAETLRIVPAVHQVSNLSPLLDNDSPLCLLKAGPVLPQLVDALAEHEQRWEAIYVENLGTEQEWLTYDMTRALGREAYFSLVLLRRRETTIVPAPAEGRAGKLWVVGLGPGDPELLTRQALRVLRSVTDVVGYTEYLESIKPLGCRARSHAFPLGAEVERARHALDLARQGGQVALVSSGDAGVYGMASLLLESAAAEPGIEIEVIPGVTAATVAAATLGAPLGHDFVCISLSDLLTPWSVIQRRLEAAGQGDFVVVLYNPASRQRTWQLPRARAILARYRAPDTPVGLVHGAYRPGMRVQATSLDALDPALVTMESTVIVGSSRTRLINGRLVTPRGYLDRCSASPSGGRQPPESSRAQGADAPRSDIDLGSRIMAESFALIKQELGPLPLPPWAFAVVRRMIHASADFDFAHTVRYSADFEPAVRAALREGVPIVTDTEMVLQGIRTACAGISSTLICHLNDPETATLAEADGLTRSAAAMRVAARRHVRPLLVIGNAPTALEEALRLFAVESWRPAAILGIPVGFVGVEEAKRHLQEQAHVPYLTCVGRKGGSAVTAAALNALVELARAPDR